MSTKEVTASGRPKPPAAGKGRPKGSQNKTTVALKEAILKAADGAHPDGAVGYLIWLSKEQPTAFASLLGRVLPHTIEGGDPNKPIGFTVVSGVPR